MTVHCTTIDEFAGARARRVAAARRPLPRRADRRVPAHLRRDLPGRDGRRTWSATACWPAPSTSPSSTATSTSRRCRWPVRASPRTDAARRRSCGCCRGCTRRSAAATGPPDGPSPQRPWRDVAAHWFGVERAQWCERNARGRGDRPVGPRRRRRWPPTSDACRQLVIAGYRRHFELHGDDLLPVGLLITRCQEWGIDPDRRRPPRSAAPSSAIARARRCHRGCSSPATTSTARRGTSSATPRRQRRRRTAETPLDLRPLVPAEHHAELETLVDRRPQRRPPARRQRCDHRRLADGPAAPSDAGGRAPTVPRPTGPGRRGDRRRARPRC